MVTDLSLLYPVSDATSMMMNGAMLGVDGELRIQGADLADANAALPRESQSLWIFTQSGESNGYQSH